MRRYRPSVTPSTPVAAWVCNGPVIRRYTKILAATGFVTVLRCNACGKSTPLAERSPLLVSSYYLSISTVTTVTPLQTQAQHAIWCNGFGPPTVTPLHPSPWVLPLRRNGSEGVRTKGSGDPDETGCPCCPRRAPASPPMESCTRATSHPGRRFFIDAAPSTSSFPSALATAAGWRP